MILKKIVFLCAGLLLICQSNQCFAQDNDLQSLVSPELLKTADLRLVWHQKLPIKNGEELKQLSIIGNRIYALSSLNYMVCAEPNNGTVLWQRYITETGLPILGLSQYDNELISTIGSKLSEINLDSGVELNTMRLDFGITCPPARNSSYFYIADNNNRLRVLRTKDGVKLFEVSAENESMITGILADENSVVFSTDAGNVICFKDDEPKRLWQFNAYGGIVGPMIRDANSLFFAGKDTNLWKIDKITGQLNWKYQAGAILNTAPRITQKAAYQYIPDKGLVAVDKNTGKLIWQLPHGLDLLAEAKDKAYVITSNGLLVVMDNKKAKQLYALDVANVSRHAANIKDSKIYIADDTGKIDCIEPRE